MKILAVSHSAVVASYRRRWQRLAAMPGVRLALLTPRWWHEANRRVEAVPEASDNFELIRRQPITWGFRNRLFRNVCHVYPGVAKLLRGFRPDVLEIWEEPFSAAAAHLVATARDVCPAAKIVFFSAQNVLRRLPPPFCWFESLCFRNADGAFPVTRAVADVLYRKGFRKPQFVLPLGVDAQQFAPSEARRADGDSLVFGYIGKLNEQKGVADLLDAFACVEGRHRLRIIGTGGTEATLRRRISQLPVRGRIELRPAVSHERVAAEMAEIDVFCLPSLARGYAPEQFGRAVVEAMSCGLPTIVSNAGQLPDTVGRAGLVFTAGDVPHLVRQMRRLIRSRRLREVLSTAARGRVLEQFTWDSIARRQIEAYRHLCGQSSTAPLRVSRPGPESRGWTKAVEPSVRELVEVV